MELIKIINNIYKQVIINNNMKVIVILDDRETPVAVIRANSVRAAWKKFTDGTQLDGEDIMNDLYYFHKLNMTK